MQKTNLGRAVPGLSVLPSAEPIDRSDNTARACSPQIEDLRKGTETLPQDIL